MSLEDYLAAKTRDRHRYQDHDDHRDSGGALGTANNIRASPPRRSFASVGLGVTRADPFADGIHGWTPFESTAYYDDPNLSSRRPSQHHASKLPLPTTGGRRSVVDLQQYVDPRELEPEVHPYQYPASLHPANASPQEEMEPEDYTETAMEDPTESYLFRGVDSSIQVVQDAWLQRKTSMMSWKDVYVVLRQRFGKPGVLCIYKDQETVTPTTMLDLATCLDVYPRREPTKTTSRYEFIVAMRRQEITLAAGTREEMQQWVEAIRSVLNRVSPEEAESLGQELSLVQKHSEELESANANLTRENQELQQALEAMQEKFRMQEQQLAAIWDQSNQVKQDSEHRVDKLQEQLAEMQYRKDQLEVEVQSLQGVVEKGTLEGVQQRLDHLQQTLVQSLDSTNETAVLDEIKAIQTKLDACQVKLDGFQGVQESVDGFPTAITTALVKTETDLGHLSSATAAIQKNVMNLCFESKTTSHDVKSILEDIAKVRFQLGDGDASMSAKISALEKTLLGSKQVSGESMRAIGESLGSISAYLSKNVDIQNQSEKMMVAKMDKVVAHAEAFKEMSAKGSAEERDRFENGLRGLEASLESVVAHLKQQQEDAKMDTTLPSVDPEEITAILRQVQESRLQMGEITQQLHEGFHQKDGTSVRVACEKLSAMQTILVELQNRLTGKQGDVAEILANVHASVQEIKFAINDVREKSDKDKKIDQEKMEALLVEQSEKQRKEILATLEAKLQLLPETMGELKGTMIASLQTLQDAAAIPQEKAIAMDEMLCKIESQLASKQTFEESVLKALQELRASFGSTSECGGDNEDAFNSRRSSVQSLADGEASPLPLRARSASPRKLLRESLQEERFIELQSTTNTIRDRVTAVHSLLKDQDEKDHQLSQVSKELQRIHESCDTIQRSQKHMNEVVLGSDQAWRTELRQAVRFDHEKLCTIERTLATLQDSMGMQQGGLLLGGAMTHDVLVSRIQEMQTVCTDVQARMEQVMEQFGENRAVAKDVNGAVHKQLHHLQEVLTQMTSEKVDHLSEKLTRLLSYQAEVAEEDGAKRKQPLQQPVVVHQEINEDLTNTILLELADIRDEVRRTRAVTEPQFGTITEDLDHLAQHFKSEMSVCLSTLQQVLEATRSGVPAIETQPLPSTLEEVPEESKNAQEQVNAMQETSIKLLREVERLQSHIEKLYSQKEEVVEDLKRAAEKRQTVHDECVAFRGKIASLEEWNAALEQKRDQLQLVVDRLQQMDVEGHAMAEKLDAEKKVARLQVEQVQLQLREITGERDALQVHLKVLKEQIVTMEAEKEASRAELAKWKEEEVQKRAEVHTLTAQCLQTREQLEREVTLLRMLQGNAIEAASAAEEMDSKSVYEETHSQLSLPSQEEEENNIGLSEEGEEVCIEDEHEHVALDGADDGEDQECLYQVAKTEQPLSQQQHDAVQEQEEEEKEEDVTYSVSSNAPSEADQEQEQGRDEKPSADKSEEESVYEELESNASESPSLDE